MDNIQKIKIILINQTKSLQKDTKMSANSGFCEDQVKQRIKQYFHDLSQYGYDFKYVNWEFGGSKHKTKVLKKYIKFKCSNCCLKNPFSKNFSTSFGTVKLKYEFQDIYEFQKRHPQFKIQGQDHSQLEDPYILKWDLRLYKMGCKICNKDSKKSQQVIYSKPFLEDQQIQQIIDVFKSIIEAQLDGRHKSLKPSRIQNKKQRNKLRGHKRKLCQACSLGVCGFRN